MNNSFHSDNFICLINTISQALTLSNDLTQSPSASQSRLIRKMHHIGCIRLIFCVFPIGSISPTITEFTENQLKGGFIDKVPTTSDWYEYLLKNGAASENVY